jgi:hypothetical protein
VVGRQDERGIGCPVTGPSPRVFWLGNLLMPFSTEFAAVKFGCRTRA